MEPVRARVTAMETTRWSVEMDAVNAINLGIGHAVLAVVSDALRYLTRDLIFDENRSESEYRLPRTAMCGEWQLCLQYGLLESTLPVLPELHRCQWHLPYVLSPLDCQTKENYSLSLCALVKQLNATCSANTECWSSNCTNSRCQCPPGYESQGDNIRCRKSYSSPRRKNPTDDSLA